MSANTYRGVDDWTQGTASIQNGQRNVALTNSGIITTDAVSGLTFSSVRSGDFFVVDGVGYELISEVSGVSGASTATLTLAKPWSAATQSGAAYKVIRMSMPSTGELRALMKSLLDRGSAEAPFVKVYADDSTGRMVMDAHSGAPGLYVGQSGVSDAALLAAMTADRTTGAVAFPSGVKGWALTGRRNRLRNASFALNQRVVSGTVTLAAGAYGHDGLKAGSGGSTYTFAGSGLDTTISPSAGSLIMPVEAGLIEGGTYVLSHDGTAQARVWQGTGYAGSGSYATASRTAPLVVTGLAAGVQTNVEFANGTILRPQFEPGSYLTAFERSHLSLENTLCQRYLQRIVGWSGTWKPTGTSATLSGTFSIRMAGVPSVIIISGAGALVRPGIAFCDAISLEGSYLSVDGGYVDLVASIAAPGEVAILVPGGLLLASAEI
ncbi:hypothetical protein IY145_10675 [Methylosinus sp. H3A]|uniref:hypothetical protein n=1 Tax=Methylosinus sp. H3A TaxID=2785786 RepID=UPI0018C20E41|nr:hypothetical protein [Methylosinus sp. H3A]MBG0809843.1 hypothetical protein [Methylosinus sp. H3A]